MYRLDDQWQTELINHFFKIGVGGDQAIWRSWQFTTLPNLFGFHLIHANRRALHTCSSVRNIEPVQYALNLTIFTATTMQNDKCTIIRFQLCHRASKRIKGFCIDTATKQSIKDGIFTTSIESKSQITRKSQHLCIEIKFILRQFYRNCADITCALC